MPASPKPFRPRDLLHEVLLCELALSPDGGTAFYSSRTIQKDRYVKRLWRVSFDGGRPERLTTADAQDGSPKASPDGAHLLFISDRSGKPQPWVMPTGGGEPRLFTELPGGASWADWSPDGRRVLVLGGSGVDRMIVGKHDDPTARRVDQLLYRLDGSGWRDQRTSAWLLRSSGSGRPRRLTDAAIDVLQASWTPDSARVLFVADMRPGVQTAEHPRAYEVAVGGGRLAEVGRLRGPVFSASRSPAGRLALGGWDEDGLPIWANQRYFVQRGRRYVGLAPHLDTHHLNTSYGDLMVFMDFPPAAEWFDDERIVALLAMHGAAHPYLLGLDGSAEQLAGGEISPWALVVRNGRIAMLATDRGRAAEVYEVVDGRARPVTSNNSRWLAPHRRDPERFSNFEPRRGAIDAWPVRAKGRGPRPLVLQIHGGPYASHGPTPWTEMLALASAGMHVLYANPSGSTGYGEAFCKRVHGNWGGPDSPELLRLIDRVVRLGIADRRRIGLIGLSYGGFMVNWLAGRYPGRFAAIVSENPVTDFVSEFASADYGAVISDFAVDGRSLPEAYRTFVERSPYRWIHRNRAPTLLLQSDQDQRCPPVNSELVFAILKLHGVEVEMIRYPDSAHWMAGEGRPDRRVDRLERIVGWFSSHL